MQRLILTLLLGTLLSGVLQAQVTVPDKVSILLKNYENALASQSAAAVADQFDNDAQILPEGKPVVIGREAIIANFKGLESIDFQESFTVEDLIEAGDYYILRTTNRGSWKDPKSGDGGSFEVKGMMVLKPNQVGDLKIYRYAYNGNGE